MSDKDNKNETILDTEIADNKNELLIIDTSVWNKRREDHMPLGKSFKRLNEDERCQISKCNEQAYTRCQYKLYPLIALKFLPPIWTGCGKLLCENHI